MRSTIPVAVVSAFAVHGIAAQDITGKLGDAQAILNNPNGAQYMASLPNTAFAKDAYPDGSNARGSIQAVSMPDGSGVMFHVDFSNLPTEGGPFIYHIHDQPVPEDGNCTGTLAHLDPYERGEATPCDPNRPETCQVGDLAGKHGTVTPSGDNNAFEATYTEDFASTLQGIGAFFGNRSFVLHFANKTRITCANFTSVAAGCDNNNGGGSPTSTATRPGETGTRTTSRTRGTPRPTGNGTATGGSPASTTFVTAGAAAAPTAIAMLGAAAFALLL